MNRHRTVLARRKFWQSTLVQISTFVVLCIDSIKSLVSIAKTFLLVVVDSAFLFDLLCMMTLHTQNLLT